MHEKWQHKLAMSTLERSAGWLAHSACRAAIAAGRFFRAAQNMTSVRQATCDDLFRISRMYAHKNVTYAYVHTVQQPGPAHGDGWRAIALFNDTAELAAIRHPKIITVHAPQYGMPFYLQYMAQWPLLFTIADNAQGLAMGYSACRIRECRTFDQIRFIRIIII